MASRRVGRRTRKSTRMALGRTRLPWVVAMAAPASGRYRVLLTDRSDADHTGATLRSLCVPAAEVTMMPRPGAHPAGTERVGGSPHGVLVPSGKFRQSRTPPTSCREDDTSFDAMALPSSDLGLQRLGRRKQDIDQLCGFVADEARGRSDTCCSATRRARPSVT